MEKKFIVVNMTTANNLQLSYEEAVVLAKQKTVDTKAAAVHGIFELKAITEIPIPDIKVKEIT